VTGPLANSGSTPSGPGPKAAQGWTLVGKGLGDDEILGGEGMVVLGIGYSRIEDLDDVVRSPAGGEGENHLGVCHRKTPDKIEHPSHLEGGVSDVLGLSPYIHSDLPLMSS
jgi:hypothetical protein